MDKPRVILGIDPGTNLLGYGLISIEEKTPILLGLGVVRLSKVGDAGEKLHHIYERITALIEGFDVREVAIEAPFFGKNVQSMLKLGRAQGVAIAAAIGKKLPVFEYVPRKIKQSVVGNGNASKEQVFAMLHAQFKFEEKPETMDATDGLAVAVCHFYQFAPRAFGSTKGGNGSLGKAGGWSQFLKENPDREL
ncbi:MAG: crossover junction endodeoxyribonuclease RuvC [Flavobacteriales bacterium]|nr:crossover junction endodeoxyribonuclease RuvC [Flavobacteriaceae bacterium]PHX92531.1 MAG: crossover junction endodeoxyribonuclease RuvC [Flavobacteriales bacterium]